VPPPRPGSRRGPPAAGRQHREPQRHCTAELSQRAPGLLESARSVGRQVPQLTAVFLAVADPVSGRQQPRGGRRHPYRRGRYPHHWALQPSFNVSGSASPSEVVGGGDAAVGVEVEVEIGGEIGGEIKVAGDGAGESEAAVDGAGEVEVAGGGESGRELVDGFELAGGGESAGAGEVQGVV
jgi:hypothetical protein